jgi:hypothetical protein
LKFREIPPQYINGELLHEREEAAKLLAMHLLSSAGAKVTPICDQAFGAGKSSLVYKFRRILEEISDWTERPEKYELLKSAVYLNVHFDLHGSLGSSKEDYMRFILATLRRVINASCGAPVTLNVDNLDDFLRDLAVCCGDIRFLFNFDDVGCFEPYGNAIGAAMLYIIWNIGDRLRGQGHFFVMTGRSSLLHIIGTGRLKCKAYSSPDTTVVIPLPPLSESGIAAVMREFRLDRVIDQVSAIHTLTGGIPRAVYAVVRFFTLDGTKTSVQDELSALLNTLRLVCPQAMSPDDTDNFRRCTELSWAGMHFTDDSMIFNEPITSLMARVGIFRQIDTRGRDHNSFKLLIPLFMLHSHMPSAHSLLAIKEYEDKGSRLECGFRRILHLRFAISTRNVCWADVGLPYLDVCRFPFPERPLEKSYPFPKISKKNRWKKKYLIEFKDAAHNEKHDAVVTSEFASSVIPHLYELMQIGQYYQPLPKSGSADAIMKCSRKKIVNFQFKNCAKPLSAAAVDIEAKKCRAKGCDVYLVVVCTAGSSSGTDSFTQVNGVSVAVLSLASVTEFLGAGTVQQISSSSSFGDMSVRLGASPIKATTLIELGAQMDNLSF